MKLLTLNAGSGSQRCSLFELPDGVLPTEPLEAIWEAKLDSTAPDQPEGELVVKVMRGEEDLEAGMMEESASVAQRTEYLLRMLWEGPAKLVRGPNEIKAIGHRIVHGGAKFHSAIRIDARVDATIERFGGFAPLHNPNNLTGIRVVRQIFGEKLPQVAVFDTAFHHTLSEAAATYAGPYEWIEKGIRRYGFHGTSFRYASQRAAQLLGRADDSQLRLILCHLGGGCSLCATIGGRSIDTTMGFTPLDGLAMSTRSGAVDPGILLYLLRQGASADELEKMLNKQSGLKGLSGLSGDTRVLLPAAESGDDGRALRSTSLSIGFVPELAKCSPRSATCRTRSFSPMRSVKTNPPFARQPARPSPSSVSNLTRKKMQHPLSIRTLPQRAVVCAHCSLNLGKPGRSPVNAMR